MTRNGERNTTILDARQPGRLARGHMRLTLLDVDQASDRFLWSRLLDLIDDGALEAEGDLDNMHASRVRRRR